MLLKKDKIFIAGHRGMAGRSICKALNEKGYKNIIDLSSTSYLKNDTLSDPHLSLIHI